MRQLNTGSNLPSISKENITALESILRNVREDVADSKYIQEAYRVLLVEGYRSAIGSYWNAVIDDLRKKVIHRSIAQFAEEIKINKPLKEYDDIQLNVTDFDLIEGAYKIGVLGLEAKKMLHHSRETRNIFDGHPDSSDPGIVKVLNMFSDCNTYVLSMPYPVPIINVNEFIETMDTDTFSKNEMSVEQAFSDLPPIYKKEMCNKIFTLYSGEQASTRLKSNIEFSFPILWKECDKDIRREIGGRIDKLVVNNDSDKLSKAVDLLAGVDAFKYISLASRRVIYLPVIKELEDNLDNWEQEGEAVLKLQKLGSNIPEEFIERYITALTLTFVGRRGYSMQFNRKDFFSNSAAPRIIDMFEDFDNYSAASFVEIVKKNKGLKSRIASHDTKLNRLRILAGILLEKPELKEEIVEYLELIVDPEREKEFYKSISLR